MLILFPFINLFDDNVFRQYLVNYLREFCHQPYFSHFAPHLTQQEV